jgi:hypothetical protein
MPLRRMSQDFLLFVEQSVAEFAGLVERERLGDRFAPPFLRPIKT